MHCRIFNIISGLYPLDGSCTSQMGQPKIPPDIAKCPLGDEISPMQLRTTASGLLLYPHSPRNHQTKPAASLPHLTHPRGWLRKLTAAVRALVPWEVKPPIVTSSWKKQQEGLWL